MAQTMSDATGGFGSGLRDWIKDIAGLAISYEQAKRVDVETRGGSKNMPDNADVVAGRTQQAASDSLGGAFKSPVVKYGLIGAGVIAAAVVLKKARVI